MSGINRFLVLGFFMAFLVFLWPSVMKIKKVENEARVVLGDQIILADVAITEAQREKGLSGVRYLSNNEGLLFIFEKEGEHAFWMKDMKIPIDIVWINNNKIVDVDTHVMPEPDKDITELKIYKPSEPVDRVLEIRGGRFDLLNIEIGDDVKIDSVIPNRPWSSMFVEGVKSFLGL
jgi:hypothetical protein